MSKRDTWLELLVKVEEFEKKLEEYERKTRTLPNETKDEWIARLNKQ